MDKSGKWLIALAGLFLGLIVIIAFALAFAGRDTTLLHQRIVHLSVNGTNVEIKLDQENRVYELPCLSTERDNDFTLLNDLSAVVKINDVELKTDKTAKIGLHELSDANRIKVEVKGGKDTRTVYFRTLPKTLSPLIITGEGTPEEVFYITQHNTSTVFKINGEGQIIWYHSEPEGAKEGVDKLTEFKGHLLPDKEIYYSYHRQNRDIHTYGYEDNKPGLRKVFNDKGENVKDKPFLSLLPSKEEEDSYPIDNKGFLLLDKNSSIVSGYSLERANNIPADLEPLVNGVLVLTPVIQEVLDNTVVWEWRGSDDPGLYALSHQASRYKEQQKNPMLYADIDAIQQDPADGNLIVAFKNMGAVVKIDRLTGETLATIPFVSGEQSEETEPQRVKEIKLLDVDAKGIATLLDLENGRLMQWDTRGFTTGDNLLKEIPKPHGFSEITTYRTITRKKSKGLLVSGVCQGYGCVAYYEEGKAQPVLEIRYPDNEKPASAYGEDVSIIPKEKEQENAEPAEQ